jgi:5-bromo-4-chloroindolyl phosphate hydrolysis protein
MAFGDEIMQGVMNAADTVTKAVETGNFSNLSSDLSATFNDTAKRFKEQAARSSIYNSYMPGGSSARNNSGVNMTEQYILNKKKISVFQKAHVSSISSTISGIIAGFFTISSLLFTLIMLPGAITFTSASEISGFIFFSLITILFGLWWKKAHDKKKLIKQFNLFKKAVGNREYISIKEFASIVQISEDDLKKSLKKMISSGMLIGARFDDEETTLILSENAFDEYKKFVQSQRQQEIYDQSAQVDTQGMNVTSDSQKVIDEGNEYLVKVRRINDMIPDNDEEHMSDKLYNLENIMKRIFEHVGQHPEKAQDLRKFMNYYLPTTEKLLNAYVHLDAQPEVGDNIKDTKKQISDALDTINTAFEKLFDDLFEEQAWDIASDISVMQTMMSQDGLMQSQSGL